jgi:hypothetical protein
MRRLNSQKGIALITTLMLLVLGFSLVATLLYFVTAETKVARLEQNYATALDAAKGGADMFIFMVQNSVSVPPVDNQGRSTGVASHNGQCLRIKKMSSTSAWVANADWAANACPALASATNPDPTVEPDATMTLGGFTVRMKVIDTYLTQPNASPPPCQNGCYWYTVNVRGTSPVGEHADISFVYRYDVAPP